MKNIHVLPTDKPSRLYLTTYEYIFEKGYSLSTDECENKHIYITSDEEIKEGDWFFEPINNSILKLKDKPDKLIKSIFPTCKKIILTTDQDLIADGVQAIDDEFLEWFVKNPSCERIEVEESNLLNTSRTYLGVDKYKIIIPKEEPKQETLEEVAEKYAELSYYGDEVDAFVRGAKWQAERMYSEKDIIDLIQFLSMNKEFNEYSSVSKETARYFLEQFKKK